MNYYRIKDGISMIVDMINMESIIPVFGSGFSATMPSHNGNQVPDGNKCTSIMKDIIHEYSSDLFDESIFETWDFNETANWFKKLALERKSIPEQEYLAFFRDYFTEVKLNDVRKNVLALPWHNAYTINIDDGIERTGLFKPILPYSNIREDKSRKDRLFKIHGDANHELEYSLQDNIVFDQTAYRRALESIENKTIINNLLTAFREFNILYIGCSLTYEPDLKWVNSVTKEDRANTRIVYITSQSINKMREMELDYYGVTDVVVVDDYEAFYLDLVHYYNTNKKQEQFPFFNPTVKLISDVRYEGIYGTSSYIESQNVFERSDILVERTVFEQIERCFMNNRILVLSGRRFSGRTSLMAQICSKIKTRGIFYFPSTSTFDYRVVKSILESHTPSLLLFDSNAMQSDVYLGINELRSLIDKNDHHILIVEALDDTYLTESLDCEIVRLMPKMDENELKKLNSNLDKYGLVKRRIKDTNLDYLIRLKEEQKIDFPNSFNLPQRLSDVECRLLLVLAAQDKIYSRDIHLMNIIECDLKNILDRLDKLCEKTRVNRGENRMQSGYKIVHNSRALVIHLLRNSADYSVRSVVENVKFLVGTFYQNKDRAQKQIAISIMQFDMLNEVYGGDKGAGKLIESVYEGLQEILNRDSHYWLQRAKSIYRINPYDAKKLKEAYRYCVKAADGINNKDKLKAQTALSLSLISGLLCKCDSEENNLYYEDCITNGYIAMNSVYYSCHNRERLNKERADWNQSYEEMCLEICNKYVLNEKCDNVKCKNMAFEIIRILNSSS